MWLFPAVEWKLLKRHQNCFTQVLQFLPEIEEKSRLVALIAPTQYILFFNLSSIFQKQHSPILKPQEREECNRFILNWEQKSMRQLFYQVWGYYRHTFPLKKEEAQLKATPRASLQSFPLLKRHQLGDKPIHITTCPYCLPGTGQNHWTVPTDCSQRVDPAAPGALNTWCLSHSICLPASLPGSTSSSDMLVLISLSDVPTNIVFIMCGHMECQGSSDTLPTAQEVRGLLELSLQPE